MSLLCRNRDLDFKVVIMDEAHFIKNKGVSHPLNSSLLSDACDLPAPASTAHGCMSCLLSTSVCRSGSLAKPMKCTKVTFFILEATGSLR